MFVDQSKSWMNFSTIINNQYPPAKLCRKRLWAEVTYPERILHRVPPSSPGIQQPPTQLLNKLRFSLFRPYLGEKRNDCEFYILQKLEKNQNLNFLVKVNELLFMNYFLFYNLFIYLRNNTLASQIMIFLMKNLFIIAGQLEKVLGNFDFSRIWWNFAV